MAGPGLTIGYFISMERTGSKTSDHAQDPYRQAFLPAALAKWDCSRIGERRFRQRGCHTGSVSANARSHARREMILRGKCRGQSQDKVAVYSRVFFVWRSGAVGGVGPWRKRSAPAQWGANRPSASTADPRSSARSQTEPASTWIRACRTMRFGTLELC